jgi:SAM-dependent methyltransferase
MKEIVKAGDGWAENAVVRQNVSAATMSVWADFPDVMRRVLRLYRDPLLTEEGSLTEMRNYSTYAVGMSDKAILELKYNDIRQAIVPGRIADEGCADGALLVPIARDFPDSDLIGIEITGEFMARCIERQRALEYGGTYIHFHQRNITEAIFQPESIDTTICNSTTHELWSYGDQEKTLLPYLKEKFRQTRKGGRLVIRDVVGPENREEEVLLWCNDKDGSNTEIHKTCADMETLTPHIAGLSTAARFERFALDYLAEQRARRRMPGTLRFEKVSHEGRRFFKLRLRDAMEFLMKKDYADNWKSELNEEFTFWSFSHWKRVLGEIGFRVRENPNDPTKGSRAYTSPWIVKNRFEGKVELYRQQGGALERLPYPVTNMVLVGEK